MPTVSLRTDEPEASNCTRPEDPAVSKSPVQAKTADDQISHRLPVRRLKVPRCCKRRRVNLRFLRKALPPGQSKQPVQQAALQGSVVVHEAVPLEALVVRSVPDVVDAVVEKTAQLGLWRKEQEVAQLVKGEAVSLPVAELPVQPEALPLPVVEAAASNGPSAPSGALSDGPAETPQPEAAAPDTGAVGRGCKRPRAMLLSPAWREGALAAAELSVRKRLEAASEGDRLDVLLQQVNYSQESVKGLFRDGRPVAQMLQELQTGKKAVTEIPMISAVLWNGRVYSADNRRLWTFKNCGMPHDSRIPVVVGVPDSRFTRKLTTPTSGRSVRRRGNEGFF